MPLKGRLIAISIGNAPDLQKLGYPAREVDRALLTICGALVRCGASIAYGGDLRPGGFTVTMYRYLAGAYADRNVSPFVHYLAPPTLRRMSFGNLVVALKEGSAVSAVRVCVGDSSIPLEARDHSIVAGAKLLSNQQDLSDWLGGLGSSSDAEAYSAMRRQQSKDAHARIALGGKMGILVEPADGFEGKMPGVVEEAILTIANKKPFIALAAFGGATRDIAIKLGILSTTEATPRGEQAPSYFDGLSELAAVAASAVPAKYKARLSSMAREDRMEDLALEIVDLLADWLD